uniref:Eukaryotic translation initiation factor 3 subunit D n=1 Tax=Panagrellus redivivus TaxID=6233 RepID=A0A7E5A0D3_PANRE
MSLPHFDLPSVRSNVSGWGPTASTVATPSPTAAEIADVIDEFKDLPFQQFNKCDRIGRVVDWLGDSRYYKKAENARYNERIYGSSLTAGTQFDYVHDNEDANFQIVDTSKPVKPPQRYRARPNMFKKINQREQERREAAKYQNPKTKRVFEKERARQQKLRRTVNRAPQRGNANRRFGDRMQNRNRMPSVQVKSTWNVLQDIEFTRLAKLSLPNVEGEDIPGENYGALHYYDKAIDRVSVKNSIKLQRLDGVFYSVTTTDDPVIQKLAKENVGNVFATDIILATLMTAPRSVNSWDIVAYRVGDKLFFDKRDSSGFANPIDMISVSETAQDPPPFEGGSLNNAKELATEALFINQNFRRQVLKRGEEPFKYENPRVPFEEEDQESSAEIAYRYRKFNLGSVDGTPITLVTRTENDSVLAGPNNEPQKLTVKAFNEWDSSMSGGVDWRSKLENQKGAVLATELKNNNCKLAKWTLQAILANSDYIKFGYVSRVNVRNSAVHEILGTQQFRPAECAQNITLNLDNCWGILRCIIDYFMKQPPGKYLILKDPLQPLIRMYDLPEDAFESSEEDEEEEDTEEEED